MTPDREDYKVALEATAHEFFSLMSALEQAKFGIQVQLDLPDTELGRRSIAKKASTIINRLNTFAAFMYSMEAFVNPGILNSGRKRKPLRIYNFVNGACATFRRAAQDNQNTINFQVHEYIGEYMFFDMIENLPYILLDNAVKYSIPGQEVSVELYIESFPNKKDENIILTISSIGPHVDNDELAKILELGFRGKMARIREKGGSGIGLSLAKFIVDAHSGELEVNSAPPFMSFEGSDCSEFTVRVRLPIIVDQHA